MSSEFVIHPDSRPGYVHLTVSDLQRQINFYQKVVGLKLQWSGEGKAGLGAGQSDLLRLTEDPIAARHRGTTGLYHFAILYPNRRELARSVARLFSMDYPNYPTDHLMTETTYLDDPEGNGIELYADTPERGSWSFDGDGFGAVDINGNPHSGREPLDLDRLFQELARDDALDQAAPEGTSIGHVHLHVADLSEANHFYHGLLGFELQGISHSVGASFVSAGGYHHHIGLNIWLGRGAAAPPEGSLGLRYFEIQIPNLDELDRLRKRLRQAGVQVEELDDAVFVRDPSGNGMLMRVVR